MSGGWRPARQPVCYYYFVISVGHVHGWLWCRGSGARDVGVVGDQHFWQRRPTWKWRGMHTMKQHHSGPLNRRYVQFTESRAISVEIRSCLNGDAGTDVQHRRQKVSLVWFPTFSSFKCVSLTSVIVPSPSGATRSVLTVCPPTPTLASPQVTNQTPRLTLRALDLWPMSGKLTCFSIWRFFKKAYWVQFVFLTFSEIFLLKNHRFFFFFIGLNIKPHSVCQDFLASEAFWGWRIISDSLLTC